MFSRLKLYCIIVLLAAADFLQGQAPWYYQWGLLPEKTIDHLIGESSGETAFRTITDLSEYNRKRSQNEFEGTLFESGYILKKLEEYGLDGINFERFGKETFYHPVTGRLEEVNPQRNLIADIDDLPFVLMEGSPNTDVIGDLVFIGDAYNGELDKMDLEGKIVLTSARPGSIMNMMLQKGVKGIVSYYSSNSYKSDLAIPDLKEIGTSRISLLKIFVFTISPRDGSVLRERLLSGEKIVVHAIVKFRTEEIDLQVSSCCIKGSDPDAGEMIISAHLFEGYGNQGASDNISGAAAILEVARVLNKMVKEGTITRPRRTLRFIWVPEFSGTIPWVNAHHELMKKTLCNINLDMVGLSLSRNQSFFILNRTSYGNAHYLNDVLENFFRYTGETNQVNSVTSEDNFFKRIVAPSGTDDPFYYNIESRTWGSDHEVFSDWGVQVPGVLLNTWPDPYYHTSGDRAVNCDPTQLKRAVFITSASAYTIASAGENEAINISGEVFGNAVKRTGSCIALAFDRVNNTGADRLTSELKRAVSEIRGTATGEIMTISSVTELAPGSENIKNIIRDNSKIIRDLSESAVANLTRTAVLRASEFGLPSLVVQQSQAERRASGLIPVVTNDPAELGYRGYLDKLSMLSDEIKAKYSYTGVVDIEEAASCINGRNSILDIKCLLDTQNKRETDLDGLVGFMYQLKEAGFIKF